LISCDHNDLNTSSFALNNCPWHSILRRIDKRDETTEGLIVEGEVHIIEIKRVAFWVFVLGEHTFCKS
jgi:hypothetical protein